jgi:uncharacterized alkaline shock family protein YloU
MAENKQYTTQLQENGVILISEDVIAAIVAQAISEVDGVAGLSVKTGSDIAELLGKKAWAKGMKILIGMNNEISVDCNINIKYGYKVVDVAKAAQNAIAKALDDAAGVTVVGINVNVCGIDRM